MCLALLTQFSFGELIFDISKLTSRRVPTSVSSCNESRVVCAEITRLSHFNTDPRYLVDWALDNSDFGGEKYVGSTAFQPPANPIPGDLVFSNCDTIDDNPEQKSCVSITYLGEDRYSVVITGTSDGLINLIENQQINNYIEPPRLKIQLIRSHYIELE